MTVGVVISGATVRGVIASSFSVSISGSTGVRVGRPPVVHTTGRLVDENEEDVEDEEDETLVETLTEINSEEVVLLMSSSEIVSISGST